MSSQYTYILIRVTCPTLHPRYLQLTTPSHNCRLRGLMTIGQLGRVLAQGEVNSDFVVSLILCLVCCAL